MPAYAGTPIGAGMPGTTSNGICCSCRNSASLPPLSNTKGSPHFSRTTIFPSRAFSTSSSEMASWSWARGAAAPTSIFSASARAARSNRQWTWWS
jgi:hypothetical protein